MPLSLQSESTWHVRKIVVIGPGIVGMPMAALLADARIREGGAEPAQVVVLQRSSPTSGWKVDSINAGRSPIGGVEPDLDDIVAKGVRDKVLSATSDYTAVRDADVILVCVQTDKRGFAPDYGPLFDALTPVAEQLQHRPAGNVPLIVFESTLAPSSMTTLVREHFARHGLVEGRDILLGNSPNRVMPGRLVERVRSSDKIVAGLHPLTPKLIQRLYGRVVTDATLYPTNSMTAEVVKTLENAYRDVRIAYAAEIVRECDARDIDFFALRERVNERLAQADAATADPTAVPSGGLLVPTIGVGGHCLPKDGILLWWRGLEHGEDQSRSLILAARTVNDASPAETIQLTERTSGPIAGRRVALLGTAYRFNSEDTRNSPTLVLARLLLDRGCSLRLHDPHVKPDDQYLKKFGLTAQFTRDLGQALGDAEVIIMCTAHNEYVGHAKALLDAAPRAMTLVDGCNIYHARDFVGRSVRYTGIGRGRTAPSAADIDSVIEGFRMVERGVANEVAMLTQFLNRHYAADAFNAVQFADVQQLAGTCVTGCAIVDPAAATPVRNGLAARSDLVRRAAGVVSGSARPAAAGAT